MVYFALINTLHLNISDGIISDSCLADLFDAFAFNGIDGDGTDASGVSFVWLFKRIVSY